MNNKQKALLQTTNQFLIYGGIVITFIAMIYFLPAKVLLYICSGAFFAWAFWLIYTINLSKLDEPEDNIWNI